MMIARTDGHNIFCVCLTCRAEDCFASADMARTRIDLYLQLGRGEAAMLADWREFYAYEAEGLALLCKHLGIARRPC